MQNDQISTYFSKFQDHEALGAEDFLSEDYICCNGNVLVMVPPPKKESDGGILFPERSLQSPSIGRVVAIPKGDPLCPVKPGDWIVTRHMEGQVVILSKDVEFRIIQFSDDHQSEILGFFPAEMYDEAQKRSMASLPEESEPVEPAGVIVH